MTQTKVVAEAAKAPKRRASSDGYARGAEQRARIIQAALKVFGEEGYERASTRLIAREAGIQPPALQYYFDSKEGLNRACAEFIAEQAMAFLSEPLRVAAATPDNASSEAALDALCGLLDALVDAVLLKREAPEWARFSARAQNEDSPAAPIMHQKISLPILDTTARLVGRVLGVEANETVRLRTHLVLSQVSILTMHRESTLTKLGWPDFDGPRRTKIKATLRAHTRGALAVQVD
jgi:AcrR family transcriptional regulator